MAGRRNQATVQCCMLELVVPLKCISALSRAVTRLADAYAVSHLVMWDAYSAMPVLHLLGALLKVMGPRLYGVWIFFLIGFCKLHIILTT